MKENIVLNKSYKFSLECIKLYRKLKNIKEFDIGRQILRSSTSIGANLSEAQGAQSRRDFIAKCHISFKELKETIYWLNLIKDSNILEAPIIVPYIKDAIELEKLMTSILKSLKS